MIVLPITRPFRIAALSLLVCLGAGCGDDSPLPGDAAPSDAASTDGAGDTDDAAAADTCRGNADCTVAGFSCYGPEDPQCGIPPQEECAGDGDCNKGETCHAIADGCSPDGVGSACGPACSAGDCDDGFECTEGRCLPVACGAGGVECSASQLCDPGSIDPQGPVHAITHGCTAIACQNDDPCPPSTVCVNGRCQVGLGTCSPPVP
jgi:hypothetical protein